MRRKYFINRVIFRNLNHSLLEAQIKTFKLFSPIVNRARNRKKHKQNIEENNKMNVNFFSVAIAIAIQIQSCAINFKFRNQNINMAYFDYTLFHIVKDGIADSSLL